MTKTKIGIIGLGLIGGSLALSLKDGYEVLGYDSDEQTRKYASSHSFCTVCGRIADMSGCAVIFVCVPVKHTANILSEATALGDVIVSDVASVKCPFAATPGRYVGGHPMAGTERGGIQSAKDKLFRNAYWCITGEGEDADVVCDIVRSIGAVPVKMTAEAHDRAVAAFSHTPHAVAYALVNGAIDGDITPIAGSGFADTTRIAQSSGAFWTEIFRANRKNISVELTAVISELGKIKDMLDGEDYTGLNEYFELARQKRLALNKTEVGGETLFVALVDRVGEFERVTGLVAGGGINLRSIALVPAGGGGALRLEFECSADKLKARDILTAAGYSTSAS